MQKTVVAYETNFKQKLHTLLQLFVSPFLCSPCKINTHKNLYISKVSKTVATPIFRAWKPCGSALKKRGITTTGRSYNLKEKQNENHSNVVVAEQLLRVDLPRAINQKWTTQSDLSLSVSTDRVRRKVISTREHF